MATRAPAAAAAQSQEEGPKPQEPDTRPQQQQPQLQQQEGQRQLEHDRKQQPLAQQHGRMYDVSYQAMNRALLVEQEALQKIHVRIQKQLQHLEAEEKIIEHMIKRQQQKPDEEPPAHS